MNKALNELEPTTSTFSPPGIDNSDADVHDGYDAEFYEQLEGISLNASEEATGEELNANELHDVEYSSGEEDNTQGNDYTNLDGDFKLNTYGSPNFDPTSKFDITELRGSSRQEFLDIVGEASVFDDDDLSLNYLRSTKKRHLPVVMHSEHRKIYPSPRQDELQTEKTCQREVSNKIVQKQLKDIPQYNIQFYQGKGNQLHEEQMDREEEDELQERQFQMMRQRQKELSLLENARQEQQKKQIFLQEQHLQPTSLKNSNGSSKPRVVLTDEQVTPSISMKSFQLPNVSLSIGDNRQYRRMSNLGGTSTQGPLSALRTLTDNYKKLEIDKNNADQRINQLEKEIEQYRQLLQKEQIKTRSLEADSRANKVKEKDDENHVDKEKLENRVNSLHKKYEALKRQLEYSRQYTLRAEEERDEAKKALIIAKQEIAIINKEYEDLKAAAQNQRTRPRGTSSPRSIATKLSLTPQPQQNETIRTLKNESRKNAISSKERYDNLRNSSHGSSSVSDRHQIYYDPEQTNDDHEKRRLKKNFYQERIRYSNSIEENGNVAPQVFQRPDSSRGFENRYIDPKDCEQIKDPCEEPQRETELSSGNNKEFNNMRDNSRCSSQECDQQVKTTNKYQETRDEHSFVNTGNKRKHSRYERKDRYSNDPSDDSDDRIEERKHNDHFGRQNRQEQPIWRDVKNGKSYLKKRFRDVTETRLWNAKGSGDHREVPFIGTGKSDSVTIDLQQAFAMAKHHDTNSCSTTDCINWFTSLLFLLAIGANTRHHHTEELGLNHDTPDIALTKVICNLTDELAHLKIYYSNLVDEYQAIDPVDSKSIRTALAEEMKGVMDDMEMKGDQIAMLYDVHKKTIKLSSRASETAQRTNSRQSNNRYNKDNTAEFSRNKKITQSRNSLRGSQKIQEISRHEIVTNGEIAIMKYT
ncbi:5760_t:CDS:10, partial [Acaulospora morrowiae]